MNGRFTRVIGGAVLALVLAPGAALAADFTGSWVRDRAASTIPGYPTYWLTRVQPGAGGGFNANAPYVVQVKQDAQTLQVTDPTHPARVYALDGKPHVAATDTMIQKVSTTSAVRGDAVVITSVHPYGGMPGNVSATETETWALSPDRRTLTISTDRVTPARRETFKQVFTRQ